VGGGHIAPPVPPGDSARDEEEVASTRWQGRIKQFEAKPMSEEEALAQMDLLGHDFFLFLDTRTNDFALLYKRNDGDYGLLAPHADESGSSAMSDIVRRYYADERWPRMSGLNDRTEFRAHHARAA
jgi:hypothetical protein